PDNSVVTGFYSILQAKLTNGVEITANDSMISNGTYPTNMFALPGAAVAMFLAVPKEKRKIAAPIIFGALSSSVLSGVTEPIEF
ncbi:PTS transporter subunit EIIC, partial [Mesomycoplasma flocculare]